MRWEILNLRLLVIRYLTKSKFLTPVRGGVWGPQVKKNTRVCPFRPAPRVGFHALVAKSHARATWSHAGYARFSGGFHTFQLVGLAADVDLAGGPALVLPCAPFTGYGVKRVEPAVDFGRTHW